MKLDEWLARYNIDIRAPERNGEVRYDKISLFFAWEDIGDGQCKAFVAAFRRGDVDFPAVPDNLIPGCCRIEIACTPLDYSPPEAYIDMTLMMSVFTSS